MTSVDSAADGLDAWFKLDRDGRKLAVGGAWTIAESARLDRELNAALGASGTAKPMAGTMEIDASAISRLDSAGAWLLLRTRRALEAAGAQISTFRLPELYQPLLESLDQPHKAEPRKSRIPAGFRGRLYKIGRATVLACTQAIEMLAYLGRVSVETGEAILSPRTKYTEVRATYCCLSASPRCSFR